MFTYGDWVVDVGVQFNFPKYIIFRVFVFYLS
jgi:hypothetical protein